MNKKELLKKLTQDKKLTKFIIEKLFMYEDLNSYYQMIDSSTGNIYCPYHEHEFGEKNTVSPAAKMYYDEERDISTIHCFTSKKSYTTYDYLTLIMEKEPVQYLLDNVDTESILNVIIAVEKGYASYDNNMLEKKKLYLNTTYEECNNNLSDYIEALYNPKIKGE